VPIEHRTDVARLDEYKVVVECLVSDIQTGIALFDHQHLTTNYITAVA
jgi:hypothetical protein